MFELGTSCKLFSSCFLTGEWDPFWRGSEKTHCFDVHVFIQGEAVIDPCRDNDEITRVAVDTDPVRVIRRAQIKETTAINTKTNFLMGG